MLKDNTKIIICEYYSRINFYNSIIEFYSCLLYTSDAADEEDSVDLGGRRIIKKKKKNEITDTEKITKKNHIKHDKQKTEYRKRSDTTTAMIAA